MNINRWLLIGVLLAGSTLGVLMFGNPQWGKWVYMTRVYYFKNSLVTPRDTEYQGFWHHYNKDGTLGRITFYERGKWIYEYEFEPITEKLLEITIQERGQELIAQYSGKENIESIFWKTKGGVLFDIYIRKDGYDRRKEVPSTSRFNNLQADLVRLRP